jgi:hypothetical protein
MKQFLLEKLQTVFRKSRNFLQFREHDDSKVHDRIHEHPTPVPILSHVNPVYTPESHFFNIRFNIILTSMPRSSKWFSSLK